MKTPTSMEVGVLIVSLMPVPCVYLTSTSGEIGWDNGERECSVKYLWHVRSTEKVVVIETVGQGDCG